MPESARLDKAIRAAEPLLLPGLVREWPACSAWRGAEGLQRVGVLLQGQQLHVMWSSGDTFVGRLEELQQAALRSDDFIQEACKAAAGLPGPHLYLAQHPLATHSGVMAKDAPMPQCLSGRALTSVNLWMCIRGSRSNIHYDPYCNLLCVAVGSKRVTMWPASATPFLYPAPVTGDSSNHSCVDFVSPDYNRHPLYRHAETLKQVVTLQPGDALYIPAFWWHQVDSTDITIAVNHWWTSPVGALMADQPHQVLAALRFTYSEALGSVLQDLLSQVPRAQLCDSASQADVNYSQQGCWAQLSEREQAAMQCLQTAVSGAATDTACGTSLFGTSTHSHTPGWCLKSDRVSEVFAALSSREMIRVLYTVSRAQPDLIRQLLCGTQAQGQHSDRECSDVPCAPLSPLAAYLLTTRLEEADTQGVLKAGDTVDGREGADGDLDTLTSAQFYAALYGCVADPDKVFGLLLARRQELVQEVKQLIARYVLC